MTEHQLSLLPFYAGWGSYQQRLVAAIAPLTASSSPCATRRNTGRLACTRRILSPDRAWWFHARMGEGSDDLDSPRIMGSGSL